MQGSHAFCTRDCFYKCCKRPHDQSYQYRDDQIFPNCAYYLIARCRYNCGLYACEVIYDTSSLLITGTRLLYRYRSFLNCSQCSKKMLVPGGLLGMLVLLIYLLLLEPTNVLIATFSRQLSDPVSVKS